MRYLGKIRLGNKEYEIKSNWLRILNNLFDVEKIRTFFESENITSYLELLPFFDREYFNRLLDKIDEEIKTDVKLKERLREDVHNILGESVEIGLDKNGKVIDIYLSNHDKRSMDDWYVFSKDMVIPYHSFIKKIQES